MGRHGIAGEVVAIGQQHASALPCEQQAEAGTGSPSTDDERVVLHGVTLS
jgi:hypothetical protein